MANATSITLHAQGQEVSAGSGAAIDIAAYRSALRLTLFVPAAVGSLGVSVETSADGATSWRQVSAFGAAVAGVRQVLSMHSCERFVRVSWTVGTSATFVVSGTAHTLMADVDDIYSAIPSASISRVSQSIVADSMIKASSDAEDMISHTRELPITQWSSSVRRRVADIAVYLILKHRGFDPDSAADELIVQDARLAEKWLMKVARDEVRPADVSPATGMGVKYSSGNPDSSTIPKRMSDNWGSF